MPHLGKMFQESIRFKNSEIVFISVSPIFSKTSRSLSPVNK